MRNSENVRDISSRIFATFTSSFLVQSSARDSKI
jgi:hypothetical protein